MDFYLLLALSGGLSGMLTAVLPGIGVVAVMAMLLPAAAGLAPLPTAILLTCICCGAQYGNAVIAILVSRPANPSSPIRHGGYLLARQGRVVPALTAAALGTLVVSTAGLLLLVTLAPLLSKLALQFGPAEYLALMVLVLIPHVGAQAGGARRWFKLLGFSFSRRSF